MSGKTRGPVTGMTQTYFLISMRKILPFVLQLIKSVQAVQFQENALPLGFRKKNGESGEGYFLKMGKFLESFQSTEVKSNGEKLGRV